MIRGVSRQIIEVRETDNRYYESAYLVVKPEYASAERAVLEREARKMLKAMDAPCAIKRRVNRGAACLKLLLPALLGAGAASLFIYTFLL